MPPLVPLDVTIYLALFGLAVGWLAGFCSRPIRHRPKPRRFRVPYAKGEGQPQPYEWQPKVADAYRRVR